MTSDPRLPSALSVTSPAARTIAGRQRRWALVIHGGAGSEVAIDDQRRQKLLAGLREALAVGAECLERNRSALDAVEATVRVLEDNPVFNAGRGAKMTRDGSFELDAAIMCGRTLAAGCIAGVRTVANPITLARAVMEKSPHVMLAGQGAEEFSRAISIPQVTQDYFFDDHEFELNNLFRSQHGLPPLLHPAEEPSRGTVGAVALDEQGNLAAATSTGGVTGKLSGRVGDTPIIGAGTYALNGFGAISCTGHGEQFIRHVAAYQAIMLTRMNVLTLEQSVAHVLHQELPTDCGGMIAIAPDGNVVMQFTTRYMSRGFVTSDGQTQSLVD